MTLSRDKIVLLSALLIAAVVVVAVVSMSRKNGPPLPDNATAKPAYDLYSRPGVVKEIRANGEVVVTMTLSKVVNGVAGPSQEDRVVKTDSQTKYVAPLAAGQTTQAELARSNLKVGGEVVVYTYDDVTVSQTVIGQRIEIK